MSLNTKDTIIDSVEKDLGIVNLLDTKVESPPEKIEIQENSAKEQESLNEIEDRGTINDTLKHEPVLKKELLIDSLFKFTYDFKYDFWTYVQYCLAFFVFYLIVWYFQDKTDENKSSQILTLINSFILVSTTIISFFTKNPYWSYFGYASFTTTNILELVLGPIYYPSKTSFLTTYLHHTMYLVFIYNIILHSSQVWPALIVELPTFILSAKYYFSINNIYIETAFGLSFFITRILFWCWFLFGMFVQLENAKILQYGTYLTSVIHVYWFSKWSMKYYNKWIYPLFQTTDSVPISAEL
jgi:hypothetical protein